MCSSEDNKPLFGVGVVKTVKEIQAGVFELVLKITSQEIFCLNEDVSAQPAPGQFFMLSTGKTFLSRPISVFHFDAKKEQVHFLILQKGEGTKALCTLPLESKIQVLGPVGNSFNDFCANKAFDCSAKKEDFSKGECSSSTNALAKSDFIAIVGGGIGVAPVAGFAETLSPKTYDFYSCFRTGAYGLEHINPKKLITTTDDGSVGIKGMLPDVLNASILKQNGYSCLFACGPEPMLKYVKKICEEINLPCYLSLEAKMACGMGACLGCTVKTTEGNRRCCKDGPVFNSKKIIFETHVSKPVTPSKISNAETQNPSFDKSTKNILEVQIAGVKFNNPVIAASGTFGYGSEYKTLFDISKLGGICSKGLTFEPRPGNSGIRLQETAGGIINSIGLENPGIEHFILNELPQMQKLGTTVIANLSGSSVETYVKGAELLDKTSVSMIELNISCPNVKAGGMAFGLQPDAAGLVTKAVREVTAKPLMVKLSPNAPALCEIAEAVIKAGADALSLVNTFQAIAIDVEKATPVFNNITAGLSGPGIKPLALRMVWDVCRFIKTLPQPQQVPVVGLGGIRTWQDAVEFIMAGASAIQVGTSTFENPFTMVNIVDGILAFMKRKKYNSIDEFKGIV